jgi:hypothetical protein
MSAIPPKADIGRAPGGGFLLGRLPALIFHFAAIETHSSNARLPGRCVKRNDAEANLVSKKQSRPRSHSLGKTRNLAIQQFDLTQRIINQVCVHIVLKVEISLS